MANHFSSCLENPMNSMKRQNDETAVGSILRRMVGTRLAEGGSAGYPLHRWQGIVPQ